MTIIAEEKINAAKTAIGNAVDRAHSIGYEDGKEDGYRQGFDEGVTSNDEEVFEGGYAAGYTDGSQVADDTLRDKYEEGYNEGHEAGVSSMIDESKIIEKTASGTNIVALDDVSELPHKISVQLSGENVGGKQVKVYGSNLFDQSNAAVAVVPNSANQYGSNYGYKITLPAGRYTVSAKLIGSASGLYIYLKGDGKLLTYWSEYPRLVVQTTELRNIIVDIAENEPFWIYDAANRDATACAAALNKVAIQVQAGGIPTEYEPYIQPSTYATDSEGRVEIGSISPNMTIVCDGAEISTTYRADWGMVTEREKQWNGITNYGKRTAFPYAFSNGYNDEAFHPLTDLAPISGTYAFYYTGITNLLDKFKKYGTKLDTSKCTTLGYYFFNSAKTYLVPEISLVGITSSSGTINLFAASMVTYIENLIFNNEGTTPISSTMFQSASHLREMRVSGVIGQSINIGDSPNLSKASQLSIHKALKMPTYEVAEPNVYNEYCFSSNLGAKHVIIRLKNIPDDLSDLTVFYVTGDDTGNSGELIGKFNANGEWISYVPQDEGGYIQITNIYANAEYELLPVEYYEVLKVTSSDVLGTVTFSQTAVNKAFETNEGANDGSTSTAWRELIATRPNWTFALK